MISEYYFMIFAYYSWFLHTIYKSNYKDTKHCLKSDRTFFLSFLLDNILLLSFSLLGHIQLLSFFIGLHPTGCFFSFSLGCIQLFLFFVGLHPTVVLLLLAWSKSNQKIKAQPDGLLRVKATLSPAKLASLKQRRLRTLRLHPPLYARPLRPFPESRAFSYDCRYCLFFSLFRLVTPNCCLFSFFRWIASNRLSFFFFVGLHSTVIFFRWIASNCCSVTFGLIQK